MMLFLSVILSLILSSFLALKYKNPYILGLIILIPLSIITEVYFTKNIAAFYYRYYYHWLFLLPLLLVLPFGFYEKLKNKSIRWIVLVLALIFLIIFFPLIITINNIKYLNSDTMWFDSFSKKYALKKNNIYDYIEWRYPKTQAIIKWCENKDAMTDVYSFDPKVRYFDDEKGLEAFFIMCNYKDFDLEENIISSKWSKEFNKKNAGAFYLSLEQCQLESKNPFSEPLYAKAYEVNQDIVCSSKQIMPYLYVITNQQ